MLIAKQPLTDKELDELDSLLVQIGGDGSMSVEELDGFQCALIACPEMVSIAEYLPKILGLRTSDATIPDEKTLNRLLELMMRNWNSIVSDMQDDGFHVPLLLCDDKGVARGNDWANAFLMGMDLRKKAWDESVKDEDAFAPLIPILALAYEDHPEKEMRPYKKRVGKKLRSDLIAGMAAAVKVLYERRIPSLRLKSATEKTVNSKPRRHKAVKIQRNDPCYCGSGKKYKKCCGALRVH
jgi:uncharacterized protein